MDLITLRVFTACCSGSFIGLLLAHDLSQRFEYGRYLWFVGALVGGLFAGITVNFPRVKTAVVDSYQRTIAWNPDKLSWKAIGASVLVTIAIALTLACTGTALYMLNSENDVSVIKMLTLFIVTFNLGTLVGIFSCVIEVDRYPKKSQEWNDNNLRRLCLRHIRMAKWLNPISVALLIGALPVNAPYYAFRFVQRNWRASLEATARAVRKFGSFLRLAYVNAHSDLAVLCFIDAAIGVAVGHLFIGNILLGAVVGGILGVIDFEVISVRVLKVARSRFS